MYERCLTSTAVIGNLLYSVAAAQLLAGSNSCCMHQHLMACLAAAGCHIKTACMACLAAAACHTKTACMACLAAAGGKYQRHVSLHWRY
jgi:hypothetical protein